MLFKTEEEYKKLIDEIFTSDITVGDENQVGTVELSDYTKECIEQLNRVHKTDKDNEETYARYRAGVVRGFL